LAAFPHDRDEMKDAIGGTINGIASARGCKLLCERAFAIAIEQELRFRRLKLMAISPIGRAGYI